MKILAVVILTLMLSIIGAAADEVSDEAIYDHVRIAIANDRSVGGNNVQVEVTKGVVELTGTVKQERAKSRIEKIVKKVKGVQRVENKLRVGPV